MLNLGIDPLHLQPRDELEQLRRASLFHPRPAGNTQNEQHARAQLHARNEADIGVGPGDAANEPDEGRPTAASTRTGPAFSTTTSSAPTGMPRRA